MGRGINRAGGIDQHDFNVVTPAFNERAKNHSANTAKAADCKAKCHQLSPSAARRNLSAVSFALLRTCLPCH
jgi:hypothetical protein